MDMTQTNRLAAKISALIQESGQSGQLSKIDRDVLLAYIRNLYELVLEEKEVPASPSQVISESVAPPVVSAPIREIPSVPVLAEEPVQPNPPVVNVIEHKTVQQPTPIQPAPLAEQPVPVAQPPQHAVVQEKQPEAPPAVHVSAPLNTEALHEIFAELTIRDLSDKLALSPIQDLSRAMGLNEKMLTQQELFGNNNQVFQDTLNYLNQCRSFDEAKNYLLEHIIGTYHWTSESKVKKAANFVKLIRRRFH